MSKKNSIKNAIILLLLLLVVLGALAMIPISNELTFEKPISEWVDGVERSKGTLSVDGVVTKTIIGNTVVFEGDIRILEVHDPKLLDVGMKIELKKDGIISLPLVRTGIYEGNGSNLAINESLGIVTIRNLFDEIVLFPIDDSDSSIDISDTKFWAESYEIGQDLLQES